LEPSFAKASEVKKCDEGIASAFSESWKTKMILPSMILPMFRTLENPAGSCGAGIQAHPVNGSGAETFHVNGADYWPEGYPEDHGKTENGSENGSARTLHHSSLLIRGNHRKGPPNSLF
jgi:hypothetical protein